MGKCGQNVGTDSVQNIDVRAGPYRVPPPVDKQSSPGNDRADICPAAAPYLMFVKVGSFESARLVGHPRFDMNAAANEILQVNKFHGSNVTQPLRHA